MSPGEYILCVTSYKLLDNSVCLLKPHLRSIIQTGCINTGGIRLEMFAHVGESLQCYFLNFEVLFFRKKLLK